MPVLGHRFVEVVVEDEFDAESIALLEYAPPEVVAVDVVERQAPALNNGRVFVLCAVRRIASVMQEDVLGSIP